MARKESKRRQNVTHIVLLFVTVVIYRTHLNINIHELIRSYGRGVRS